MGRNNAHWRQCTGTGPRSVSGGCDCDALLSPLYLAAQSFCN
jgi:hypothetical protein